MNGILLGILFWAFLATIQAIDLEDLASLKSILSESRDKLVALDFVSSQDGRVHGWVDQSSVRGTWDIIWTCLTTTFICTYTLLCLNVPASGDSSWTRARRRFFWMVFAVFAPEIVLTYAAGQWSRAKHSVEAFRASGYEQSTLRLAFFADMGGFFFQCPGCEGFPLNAKQLHWLIIKGFVPFPETTVDEIWDKSKQDRMAKFIAAFQIGYLVIQCIGRLGQNLAITTLELNTLAIVVCSLMTAFTWLHKPSDVATPVQIYSSVSIEDITEGRVWINTPLDFVDQNGPGWAMNLRPFMGMPVIPEERPIQRIPNDRVPMDPYGTQEYFLCFVTLVFTGIHVAGWNLPFPSRTERILWRVACLILFGVTATFWILETMASWTCLGRWKWLYLKLFDSESLPRFREETSARLDQEKPREMSTLPLPWEFWTIAPIGFLYGVARIFQLVEGFLELRDIDASAFVHVDWTQYFPHI